MAEGMTEEESKVAVITGASSGIGMATALRFAGEGYNVVLAARRQKELQQVAKKCEERGVQALSVTTDVTSDPAMHKLADAATKNFGRIDVWVNDAGVYLTGKFQELPLEDMRRIMDTNFFGTVHGSHAALMQFRKQGEGTLINISSVNAVAPMPYVSIYSASKAAIRAFDDSLRMELRLEKLQDKVHVCTVMPASVDTNLFQNAANYTGKQVQALEPVYDPEDVAKQIIKLAEKPQREVIVGNAGKMMAMESKYTPGMYERASAKITDADLLGDQPAMVDDGNLYEPTNNRGMRGGWKQRRMRGDYVNAGLAGAGLLASLLGALGLGYIIKRRQDKTKMHFLPK